MNFPVMNYQGLFSTRLPSTNVNQYPYATSCLSTSYQQQVVPMPRSPPLECQKCREREDMAYIERNLTPAQKQLREGIEMSWWKALKQEFFKQYFINLSDFIEAERRDNTVYPPQEDVFSWTWDCIPENVKVVIVGQDPYPGPDKAHGLSFSINPEKKIPRSLQNIYSELEESIDGFRRPKHGYLRGWAREGVLLLNAVLTVRKGVPNSHQYKGWEQFTDAVISYLNDDVPGVVFMLWGECAQKKSVLIDKKKHCVLTASHPSPYSAKGFFECDHFSICDQYLTRKGRGAINWNYLPVHI